MKNPITRRRKQLNGQALIEMVAGSVVLIPITLALVDLAMLAIGGNVCAELAKQAARAAANTSSASDAAAAVELVGSKFPESRTFNNLSLTVTRYDNSADGVTTVVCSVTVLLPVAVPMLNVGPLIPISIQASQPIVGIAPPPPA